MKDLILENVNQFLARHLKPGAPLLLGCSGGPDSLALLHLLSQCRQFFSIELHVAHVDHSWREQSAGEAEELSFHVQRLGYPFHLHTLGKGEGTGEAEARRMRIQFFSKLFVKLNCQALILGHQADDQAETVLKRVLEGASLAALGGIKQISHHDGMEVWRPLLLISKSDILKWLEKDGLKAIDDPTNYDPKYLRSRMRVKIFPDLEESFGKSISQNLVRLGELAGDMKEYLQRKSPLFQVEKKQMPDGIHIDLNPYYPLDAFELKIFLKHLTGELDVRLSWQELENLQTLIEEKAIKKTINSFTVDNGYLYLFKS